MIIDTGDLVQLSNNLLNWPMGNLRVSLLLC